MFLKAGSFRVSKAGDKLPNVFQSPLSTRTSNEFARMIGSERTHLCNSSVDGNCASRNVSLQTRIRQGAGVVLLATICPIATRPLPNGIENMSPTRATVLVLAQDCVSS